ncbi:RecQ family ATP-dependent DNA helicase [Actinomycetospora callitridis]|uniref:RecQ family ATP-dependent DNA helicase n=1 Tax=Actinomycetospora callitridis TaxID=913944 RepID=UPI0023663B72|nr:RecQ family ATP-dependent DNA helicase [Actinomycetospora callitridis]MDD7920105.1 RecQ family ATP-dependent DNA helicase [Actinomycetospora callitridis]
MTGVPEDLLGPCGPVDRSTLDAVDAAVARVLGEGVALGDGQREAVLGALVDDCLAVLPPAAGKTAVYAVTGLVLGGPTIVVSPTLSLHRDQVAHLGDAGVRAAVLNSGLSARDRSAALDGFGAGEVDVLVTSPEQLARTDVLEALAVGAPTLLAVDEVHCVCDWGPDFRPDYLTLAVARRRLGHPRLLGLTATASVPARQEILELLGVPDACVVVRDPDRPHIHLTAHLVHDEQAKWDRLVREVAALEGTGIVYVTTRAHTTLVRDRLRGSGVAAEAYHGGMKGPERARVQDAFMAGDVPVVVATSAFGMGIDKPDVRWVVHGDTPTSIDAYHQEIGRAGRDGRTATAVLFHRPQDLVRPRLFASGRDAGEKALETVLAAVRRNPEGVEEGELAAPAGLSKAALSRAVPALVALGAVRRLSGRRIAPGDALGADDGLAGTAAGLVRRRREREQSKVELVRRYAEATGCRRRTLLEALGETRDEPCGHCDQCDAGRPGDPGDRTGLHDAPADGDPVPGEAVRHQEWGRGTVTTVAEDSVVVLFDGGGYRTLSLPVVREKHLLEPA